MPDYYDKNGEPTQHAIDVCFDPTVEVEPAEELARLERGRDEALARLQDYEDDKRRILDEECAPDKKHCTCVPILREELAKARKRIVDLERCLSDPAAFLDSF